MLEGLAGGFSRCRDAWVRLVVPAQLRRQLASSIDADRLIGVDPGGVFRRVLWEQTRLMSLARAEGCGVLLGLASQLPVLRPWRGLRTGLLIQNIGPLLPEVRALYSGQERARMEARGLLTVRSIRTADVVFLFTSYGRTLIESLEPNVRVEFVAPGGVPGTSPGLERRPGPSDRLLLVGDLCVHKGVEDALVALARPELAGLRLDICGAPIELPYYHRLVDLVGDLGLGGRVEFLGSVPRPRVFELLAGALCLVQTSRVESLALPLIEAMSAGVPVVSSDIPVAREICGDLAEFYTPGDAIGLADRIASLREVGTPPDWGRRVAARISRMDWSRTAEEMVRILSGV